MILDNKKKTYRTKKNKKIKLSGSTKIYLKITPKSFIHNDLFKRNTVPLLKKRKKVSDDDFTIPEINEYELLLKNNYNVKQLRSMCRYYNQKVGGNKPQLIALIYNYLKFSFFSIKIQKSLRGYLVRSISRLRGPAWLDKTKCVNDTDFYTLDDLTDIPDNQFISFKDSKNFIYGFDICSLYNMIAIEKCTKNPYNREELPKNLLKNIKKLVKLSKISKNPINIVIEDGIDELSLTKQRELRAMAIFQKIDEHGFITDATWFLNLNRHRLRGFLRELIDVWNYRAQISNETKLKINPGHGNPFWNINIAVLLSKPFEVLQNRILDIIEIFITKGEDEEGRALGTYYVLGTLTIVSHAAANSLPWLYESFIPNL